MSVITPQIGLAGRFRLIVRDGDTMEVTKDTGWFNNLILDQGLNLYGSNPNGHISQFCQVGTSNVAPNVTQTALVARVAGTSDMQESIAGNSGVAPYYGWVRSRYRFAVGAAAGNLSEVGVSGQTNAELFSRALIVDGGGSPTTITVLPTEVLDVWYELRMYPDPVDKIFQLQVGPTLHDCVLRPANIGSFQMPATNAGSFARGFYAGGQLSCYSGAIGAITSSPSGFMFNAHSSAVQPYSSNSYRRAIQYTYGLSSTGNIRSVATGQWPAAFQCEFTPVIPKTNTNTLTLTFRVGWNRHVP